MSNQETGFWGRVQYRVWQFFRVLNPQVDGEFYDRMRAVLPPAWRPALDALGLSEKAHVLRLCRRILAEPALAEEQRQALLQLALTHDAGKAVTKPFLFERIMKTLLPLPNRAHPRVGAKILERLGAQRELVLQVARHHEKSGDALLTAFQAYDNSQ